MPNERTRARARAKATPPSLEDLRVKPGEHPPFIARVAEYLSNYASDQIDLAVYRMMKAWLEGKAGRRVVAQHTIGDSFDLNFYELNEPVREPFPGVTMDQVREAFGEQRAITNVDISSTGKAHPDLLTRLKACEHQDAPSDWCAICGAKKFGDTWIHPHWAPPTE